MIDDDDDDDHELETQFVIKSSKSLNTESNWSYVN